jgi:sulfur relay (sulfurtransferase) DsrF/TusC family protein
MILVRSGPENKTRVQEALRLSLTLIGMNFPTILVFMESGVKCLRHNALDDLDIRDYLQAATDLTQIFVLIESIEMMRLEKKDIDHEIIVNPLNIDELTMMMKKCGSVAVY